MTLSVAYWPLDRGQGEADVESRLEPDHNNNCYYNGMYDHGAMGLAKMRRDGFVGLRAGMDLI